MQNLHYSLFVSTDQLGDTSFVHLEIVVGSSESDPTLVNPGFVHLQHFVDAVLDVEFSYVFPELVCLDLGKVQQVLHKEGHHLGGRLMDLEAFIHLV